MQISDAEQHGKLFYPSWLRLYPDGQVKHSKVPYYVKILQFWKVFRKEQS